MKWNLKQITKLLPAFLRKPKSKPTVLAVAKSSTNPSLTSTRHQPTFNRTRTGSPSGSSHRSKVAAAKT